MPLLDTIIGGNVGDLFQKIVGTFKLSPEKAAEMKELQDQHAVDLQKIQLDMESKAQDTLAREVEAASANIRAEASSGDKYTSRARPSFIYIMLFILLANYVIFPLWRMTPLQFPDALFWLFGSCMLGYTGARTWEKIYQGQGK
jgi:hypothetical protein